MRYTRHLILIAVAGFIGLLVALSSVDQPVPSQLGLQHEDSILEPEQRIWNTSPVRVPERLESQQSISSEPRQEADAPSTSNAARLPALEESIARTSAAEPAGNSDGRAPEFNLEDFEQRFAGANRDPDWSSGMESRILAEISQIPGLAANLIEVDCRATRCRVQLTLPAIPSAGEAGLVGAPGNGPRFAVADEVGLETEILLMMRGSPGSNVVVTYLRRPSSSNVQSTIEPTSSV